LASGAGVGLYLVFKVIKRIWLGYQAKKDRSYNVFDKAELSVTEKKNMKSWEFNIPKELKPTIT